MKISIILQFRKNYQGEFLGSDGEDAFRVFQGLGLEGRVAPVFGEPQDRLSDNYEFHSTKDAFNWKSAICSQGGWFDIEVSGNLTVEDPKIKELIAGMQGLEKDGQRAYVFEGVYNHSHFEKAA